METVQTALLRRTPVEFYCPHAPANGNQCIRIREKTLELSSTVLCTLSPYREKKMKTKTTADRHSVMHPWQLPMSVYCDDCITVQLLLTLSHTTYRYIKKVAHTPLPSVGFRSWSRFLAVSLQVMWVINPAVGCHYFLPGMQLPPQPLRGLLPILLLGEQRHNGCE